MSLTLGEARTRASRISGVSYEIDLDLTDSTTGRAAGTFGCTTTVRFASSAPDTFLELTAATDLAVTVNGVALPADLVASSYDGRRLALDGLVDHNVVTVAARVPYVTDGDGMYLFTDPADGETYASAYCGMDVAQRVFACFDQNDLKATVALSVTADPTWSVVANGRALEDGADGSDRVDGRWRFATTEVFAIPMFVVCAGPWHSRTWEHAGLPFGWHARRSLAAELDRDFDELRATTTACFDHYATLFTEPMPYDSYDQAFVPGQNWGALESPGCVTYRDELLPRGRVTDLMRSQRASVIAHEMAHMWFGNLVTMTWWEDTWLQESFADYMGYRVSAEGAGFTGALLQHELLRKPHAYQADERRSTHPVAPEAEDVPDVDAASNNFDAISYSKGNSVLRQLLTWLGDEAFLKGVNAYLGAHRLGNGTLADFMAALDSASDRDVLGWVDAWLRTSGFDTIRVTRDGDVPVVTRDGTRPHRLRLTSYDEGPGGALVERDSAFVDVGDEPVRLHDWSGRVVVPNSHGETFARVVPDPVSWSALVAGLSGIDDDLVRAIVWTTAFDLVHTRRLPADDFLSLVARHLPHERHVTAVAAVLGRTLDAVVPRRLPAAEAAHAVDLVADACARGLAATDDEQVRIELTRGLARSSRDVALLEGWLAAGVTGHGVELDPALRWRVVHRLAEVGALDAAAIEAERLADGTIDGELGAVRALAARPTVEAKAAAWAALAEDDQVSNRRYEALTSGLWSPEQADLLAPYVAAYWQVSPGIAERRGQAFSQVVHRAFPALALTDEQVADLERALAGDVPTVLRRGWEDRLDDLTVAKP